MLYEHRHGDGWRRLYDWWFGGVFIITDSQVPLYTSVVYVPINI